MRIFGFFGALLLLALGANPCSVSPIRKLWAKAPGAQSKLFAFERDGRVGFIDSLGNVVVKPTITESIDRVGDYSEGLARVRYRGYIDESGNWVITGDYRGAEDFSDGLVRILVEDANHKSGWFSAYMNRAGKILTTTPAFKVAAFSEGLASFEAEGKPGLRSFKPGNLQYRDFPGLKGFIDRTGNVVIRPAFADVGPFVGGLARAVVDGYCHLATPDNFQEGSPTSGYPSSCGGAPADATTPCAVGFIDRMGGFAIQPRFESARDFQEDLAAVRIDGLWGFVSADAKVIIAPRFEQAQSFREGLAAVRIDGKWGFIDKSGTIAIPPRFDAVEPFSESLALVYSGTRPLYIDREGRRKITGSFREATSFVHGLAAVLLSGERVAYINKAGSEVFVYTWSSFAQ